MITLRYRTLMAFAAGLAVALIGVFAFQSWRADAAPGDSDTTFVPITACRLIDTRPAPDRVGSVGTFTADDTNTTQARGTNGNCTIPTDAVGLSLNVTAVDASQATFLTVWPGGTKPTASSLNPTPGEPPTPNAVTTPLSSSGAFNVFNRFGTVDVIIDINGYYTRTSLQQINNRLTALEGANAGNRLDALEAARPLFALVAGDGTLTTGYRVVSVTKAGTGGYDVKFDRSVVACAKTATIGGQSAAAAGVIDTALSASDTVTVFTQSNDGVPPAFADRPFNLVVNC